jgi:hypothetical protein
MKIAILKDPCDTEVRLIELTDLQNEDIPMTNNAAGNKGPIPVAGQQLPPTAIPAPPPSQKKQWQCRIGYYTIPTNDAETSVKMYEKLFAYIQQPPVIKKSSQDTTSAKPVVARGKTANTQKKSGTETVAINVSAIQFSAVINIYIYIYDIFK